MAAGQLTPVTDWDLLCVCVWFFCFFLPLSSLPGFNQARSIQRRGPDFDAWPFLDSVISVGEKNCRLCGINVLRVCIPILPVTKAWPDHPNLPLG